MSSKKRPGVEASIRLVKATSTATIPPNVQLWEQIEQQYDDLLIGTKNTGNTKKCIPNLSKYDEACQRVVVNNAGGKTPTTKEISKQELLDFVEWKFTVGKPRPANRKLIHTTTTDTQVREVSRNTIELAKKINIKDDDSSSRDKQIKEIVESLSEPLKGVGPATATAILCRIRPDIFCYMYDEVIDTFLPKRTYTIPVYLQINTECTKLAQQLNNTKVVVTAAPNNGKSNNKKPSKGKKQEQQDEEWTTARVAKVLWTAARVLTIHGKEADLTGNATTTTASTKIEGDVDVDDNDDDTKQRPTTTTKKRKELSPPPKSEGRRKSQRRS